ncbi:MAG: tetratricopeptide repeat protein [Bacteroidota bacterium]
MNDRINKLIAFLENQPGDNFLQHALALEYVKIGEDDTARNLFETILERDPGYVGSYYHLGRLLERQNENEQAIAVYENGVAAAKVAGDNHARNELQMALDDLM